MTKFFLDSCNPDTTKKVKSVLGNLYGQTTNPSLLVKNPKLQNELVSGKLSEQRLLELYKEAVVAISKQIPEGSVSIEVYADSNSTTSQLLKQAENFYTWIPNAHIKFPTINTGLEAAENFVANGGRVNMTLVFSQAQSLAVHLVTIKAKNKGDVFVSPFIGRLDEIGQNGIELVSNIQKMYAELDSKVEVLAASVRTLRHFQEAIALNCDIITAPSETLIAYKKDEIYQPQPDIAFAQSLASIPYQDLNFSNWQDIDIKHELTDKGLIRFTNDWNGVLL